MVQRAVRYHEEYPCYWLRGLGLSTVTNHPVPAVETSFNIRGVEPAQYFDPRKAVFLDGSGGEDSADCRLRRVGWAWCQYRDIPTHEVRPHLDSDDIGQFGTIEGRQSVPRAELFALMAAVLYTAALPKPASIQTLLIISDNKAVVDGFYRGPKPGQGNMDDLWEKFWAIYEIRHRAPEGTKWSVSSLPPKAS